MLYVRHHPHGNGKLVAILQGATWTRHLYGTTLLAHQQFSRSFFEPNAVYIRFSCIPKHQPLFYIGSTEDHTLGREHTRYRKFKQVSGGQFVLSELAIRFWSHNNNFFLVVTSSHLHPEFMHNQQGVPPSRNITNFSEAFHQSLLTYKCLHGSLWKTVLMNTIPRGPALWS